jgi:heat shock protein HtpX
VRNGFSARGKGTNERSGTSAARIFGMLRRVALFALAVAAVVAVASVWLKILQTREVIPAGTYASALAAVVLTAVAGSLLTLVFSVPIAKWIVRARPHAAREDWVLHIVERLAKKGHIQTPELAVYESPDMNAFAIGMTKNQTLLAVSTGLLSRMRREEIEAVIGHEIAHIGNGDTVTLALLQGLLDTFVLLPARVLGGSLDRLLLRNVVSRHRGPGFVLVAIVAQVAFGFLATLVVTGFSRWREYRADRGAAELVSRKHIISALEHLKTDLEPHELPDSLNPFFVRGGPRRGPFALLFAAHPALDERIRAISGTLDAWPAAHEI